MRPATRSSARRFARMLGQGRQPLADEWRRRVQVTGSATDSAAGSATGGRRDHDEIQGSVDVHAQPPARPEVRDGHPGPLFAASGGGRCRRGAAEGPPDPRPARSPPRPRNSGCSRGRGRAVPRRLPRNGASRRHARVECCRSRERRGRPHGRRWPPAARAPPTRAPLTAPPIAVRSRSPNVSPSGGPATINASSAPAARNASRCLTASAWRASARARTSGPASLGAWAWKMSTATGRTNGV